MHFVKQFLYIALAAALNILQAGVAKSQKYILVHGQLVVKKHLSVPRLYLPVHK